MKPFSFPHLGRLRIPPPGITHHLVNGMTTPGLWALVFLLLGFTGLMAIADVNGMRILDLSLKYPGSDKLAHFIMHGGLVSILYFTGRRIFHRKKPAEILVAAVLVSILLGLIDEMQQRLVASRSFELLDIVANLCGSLSAAIMISLRNGRFRYRLMILLLLLGVMGLVMAYSYSRSYQYQAGLMHIKQKDYAAARLAFRSAIAQGKARPALYNELAWIELEYLGTDPAISLVYTEQAIAARPDNPAYLETHGWALHMTGRHRAALKYLLAAYRADSTLYCINYHLGAVYYALGMTRQARHHLQAQVVRGGEGRFERQARHLLGMLEAKAGSL